MEFNGAVLVTNQKIENALENYKLLKGEYESEIARCEERLALEIGDLTWWNNFWKYSRYSDWVNVYIHKYKGYVDSFGGNDWFYNFYKLGLVEETTFQKLRDISINHIYYHRKDVSLTSLVQAGTPVYLNPEQADFVNTFYKNVDTSY